MTYIKPANLKYTDIAIWIDDHSTLADCDEQQLYEYLYHIINMLAHEHKYFTTYDQYDDFALYGASKLFMRIRKPALEEVVDLPPIKSILNYAKRVIYPYKVDFDQQFSVAANSHDISFVGSIDLGALLSDQSDVFESIDFGATLGDIDTIFKSFIRKLPCKQDSAEAKNIYISCLLTFLDGITQLPDEAISNIHAIDAKYLDKIYKQLSSNPVILYHLDKSYADYIQILVVELKHIVAKLLSIESKHTINEEASAKSLILASMKGDELWD